MHAPSKKITLNLLLDWRLLIWVIVFFCTYFLLPFDYTDVYSFIPMGREFYITGSVNPHSNSWLTASNHLNFPFLTTLVFERVYFYAGDLGLAILHFLTFITIFLFWYQLWQPFLLNNHAALSLGLGLVLFYLWQPFLILRPAIWGYLVFYLSHTYLLSLGKHPTHKNKIFTLILLALCVGILPFLHASALLILIYLAGFAIPMVNSSQRIIVLSLIFALVIGFVVHPLKWAEIFDYFYREMTIEPDMEKPEFNSLICFPALTVCYLAFTFITFPFVKKKIIALPWLLLPFYKVRLLPFALLYLIPFLPHSFLNPHLFRFQKLQKKFLLLGFFMIVGTMVIKKLDLNPWQNQSLTLPTPILQIFNQQTDTPKILASYELSGYLLTKTEWGASANPNSKIRVALDIFNYLNHGQAWQTYLNLFERADLNYWRQWVEKQGKKEPPFNFLLLRSRDKLFTLWPQLPLKLEKIWHNDSFILLKIKYSNISSTE